MDEYGWFWCDPEKNTECRKFMCFAHNGYKGEGRQVCRLTSKEKFAKTGADGKPERAERADWMKELARRRGTDRGDMRNGTD